MDATSLEYIADTALTQTSWFFGAYDLSVASSLMFLSFS